MIGHVPITVQYRPTLDTNAAMINLINFIFLQHVSPFMPLSLMGHTKSYSVYKLILTLHIMLKYTINFKAGALSICKHMQVGLTFYQRVHYKTTNECEITVTQ